MKYVDSLSYREALFSGFEKRSYDITPVMQAGQSAYNTMVPAVQGLGQAAQTAYGTVAPAVGQFVAANPALAAGAGFGAAGLGGLALLALRRGRNIRGLRKALSSAQQGNMKRMLTAGGVGAGLGAGGMYAATRPQQQPQYVTM